MNWRRSAVLVTGGTGTLGRKLVETLLPRRPRRLVVFSRDEHKQHEMRQAGLQSPVLEYVVGDVRDARSVRDAVEGIDVVVHAAALKQVGLCEAQPIEAIRTNVLGAQNVIDAALDAGVGRVAALSSDKSVHPINVYGATKLLAERLFLQADLRRGRRPTRFASVRYGNVLGSRSSVLPALLEERRTGRVTITDQRMTRFWMHLDEAVAFVLGCLDVMRGGEVFVPHARGARTVDLIAAVAGDCKVDTIGRRPGEKIHELLVSEDEAPYTIERDGMYVIYPWRRPAGERPFRGQRLASDTVERLGAAELRALALPDEPAASPPDGNRAPARSAARRPPPRRPAAKRRARQ